MSAPRRGVRGVTVSLLVGTALPLATAFHAQAADTAPVVPVVAPVITIKAPVLDISFGEADLKRRARVDKTPRRTVVTLDSTVFFAKDSPKINSRARSRLTEVGRGLKAGGAGSV